MTDHGEPDDGDLIDEPGKIPVPGEVADAIKTLIRWAGDDPNREGLLDTPKRSSAPPRSPICPRIASSASPSSRACCTVSHGGCRCRSG